MLYLTKKKEKKQPFEKKYVRLYNFTLTFLHLQRFQQQPYYNMVEEP